MRVEAKLHGVDNLVLTLKSLPPEIVSKKGGPVKLALAKGARLLRDEAKRNLLATIRGAEDAESTGLLVNNVISSRGKPPAGGRGERYLVRVRRKIYTGRKPERDGKVATNRKTAQIKEYGSSRQRSTPWLRPAVQNKGGVVIEVVRVDLLKRVDRVVIKLAKGHR